MIIVKSNLNNNELNENFFIKKIHFYCNFNYFLATEIEKRLFTQEKNNIATYFKDKYSNLNINNVELKILKQIFIQLYLDNLKFQKILKNCTQTIEYEKILKKFKKEE
ncbi:hypothetical protein [Campylobacter canadensis]|uniref:hypothetical protein n=1 Tax=Campylobacter canadensis TaxID=449520 RepID=UPI001CCF03B2|nr:hypothetical protein [Campylobacter canadensis]MBZ8002761.1 hypothetical protein [Campylobacter canadensis]